MNVKEVARAVGIKQMELRKRTGISGLRMGALWNGHQPTQAEAELIRKALKERDEGVEIQKEKPTGCERFERVSEGEVIIDGEHYIRRGPPTPIMIDQQFDDILLQQAIKENELLGLLTHLEPAQHIYLAGLMREYGVTMVAESLWTVTEDGKKDIDGHFGLVEKECQRLRGIQRIVRKNEIEAMRLS